MLDDPLFHYVHSPVCDVDERGAHGAAQRRRDKAARDERGGARASVKRRALAAKKRIV